MTENIKDNEIESRYSLKEKSIRENILQLFKECPIPDYEIMGNLGLFIKRQDLSHILFMNDLYQKIINVHGIVVEFGVRWGINLSLFESLRGIYEPHNYNRKIVGFDTFEGFPSTHEKDGDFELVKVGTYKVAENYEEYLSKIMDYHENESPISHKKKYEIIKGDAIVEMEKYLTDNPETIIAFAYFDFDIYEPTRKCLELIKNHITRGTVIGFDELNYPEWPGETIAFKEIFGLDKYSIRRSNYSASKSYIVIE